MNDEPVEERETTAVPPSAEALQDLVEHLYPEPSVVDIITLDQFVYRYKLSGLGPSAVADMERAQRITRTLGDYVQNGLAEFHIGLIYLYWGQFLGAISYFDDARRHWNFAKNDLAMSLAEFAEGVCHHHGFQYESALANYGKVQRLISRIRTNGSVAPAAFLTDLEVLLRNCRDDVVEKIRTGGGEIAPNRLSLAAPPISNLPPPFTADTQPDLERAVVGTPVLINGTPVPRHVNQTDHLVWYRVVERDDVEDLFPCVLLNNALLVDVRSGDREYKDGDLVIIKRGEVDSGILVRTLQETVNPDIVNGCLVRLNEVNEQFYIVRDSQTSEVRFESGEDGEEIVRQTANQSLPTKSLITPEQIIGAVLGMWSNAQLMQK